MADRLKILIVEDDVPTATMMVHVLLRADCGVTAVHTGKRGMELAQESRFDLIVLEVDLPDISGFDICRDLKQRHLSYRTPVIFISGRLLEEDKQRGLDLGAVDCLAKPFIGIDLVSRLLSHVKVKRKSGRP
jgi:DNA-binding response OmpR family regulator